MAAENDRRQRADDNYKRLRKQLDERLKADEKLKKTAEKIKQGKADFKDTSEYSKIISEYLGKIISENIGEINNPMGKELVCKALLEDNYELINGVLGEVQASVDEKMGVHIKPQKAPFPAERVMKAAHSLEDKTVPVETIKRRAKSASTNVSMSFHDDYMKANADFRSNAGLTCYITRTDSGKCCDWCSKVAGRYVYGKEPADIFRRHDNCKCSVIYENGRQRQDVWSKRTWERPATPEPYEPTVLSPSEAKEIQQRKLEGYKGLTKPPKESKIEESEDSKEKKPTVLSPEQAKEIQREKLDGYKGIPTGEEDTDELQSELGKFKKRLRADERISDDYYDAIKTKFSHGSDDAKKAFNKFVPEDSVADAEHIGTAAYSPSKKKIRMNYYVDLYNHRGVGVTWFHEHGHMIDDMAGNLSDNEEFYNALFKDKRDYTTRLILDKGAKDLQEAYSMLTAELMDTRSQSGVADIFNGLTVGKIKASGYHDEDYWCKENLLCEAFAHMYEAQFDEVRYTQMKKYFPGALSVFEKILKEAVK